MTSAGPFRPKLLCDSMTLGKDSPQSFPRMGLCIEALEWLISVVLKVSQDNAFESKCCYLTKGGVSVPREQKRME